MLTIDEARQLVRRELDAMSIGDALVILDHLTMERPWGWVFFYDLIPKNRKGTVLFSRSNSAWHIIRAKESI